MPMTKYEIRNEFSLADPELYRAADKNDPEALLEGVAMAGLVGVLRQLGDLAEFAAEIFHNLHEDIMATAARGHSLMVRVQQLETEVPSIERAFLSQTDHSSFFYNNGIDWRSNLRIDENLVTQGDLPRFIMDSYEECRPPPRLFLLDKFDVAGAGACLKRFTDPSFFKVETSRMTSSDVQWEKKILKPKKKGSRWRNGETPEIIASSGTKLHELLSEERAELGVSNPSRRVKLKRKLNGFPFDSKTGKSYMEKLFVSSSSDNKLVDEVHENAFLPMVLARSDENESSHEVLEVRSLSTGREGVGRKRSPPSPDRGEILLNSSIDDPTKVPADDDISTTPNTYYGFAINSIPSSAHDKVTGEKVIAVDAECPTNQRLTGYESDGISSDVEDFVDAPLVMDSESDTEPKFRMKNDFASPLRKSPHLISDANKDHINYRLSDSRSTGDSLISDERKEISSFYSSDSAGTSVENPHLENSAKSFASAGNPEIEIGGTSSFQKRDGKGISVDQHSQPVVCYSTYTRTDSNNSHTSDFDMPASRLSRNESMSSSLYSDPGVVTKYMLKSGLDETASTLDDNEKETTMVIDTHCHPSISESEFHHVDKSYCDGSLRVNRASRSRKLHVKSRRTIGSRQLGSSEDLIPGKSDDEFSKVRESSPPGNAVAAHPGNNILSVVPSKDDIIYKLDDEDSNFSVDSPNNILGPVVPSLGRGLSHKSLPTAETADAEEKNFINATKNKISSENLMLHPAKSPDCLRQLGLDVKREHAMPEPKEVHENISQGYSESFEVVGLLGIGITGHVSHSDTNAMEISDHMLEHFEKPAGTSDPLEMDEIIMPKRSVDQEVTDVSDSADLKSLNEAHVKFDESGSEKEISGALDAVILHVDYHTEESKAQENVALPDKQLDQELPHSVTSPMISTLSDINHPQKIDHDVEDHKDASDSAFTSSLVGCPNSQSVSQTQRQGDCEIDLSGRLIDSLGSKFTLISPSSETNQIDLSDQTQLPPLPPMLWRMGNRALSYTEDELRKLESLPEAGSSLTPSTDGVGSTSLMTSNDDLSSSLLVTPNSDVSFPLEKTDSLVQTATEAASGKEGVENSCTSLDSKDDHATVDLPTEIESNQPELAMTTPKSESTPAAKEDVVEHGSCTQELPHPCNPLVEEVDVLDTSQPSEVTEQVRPQVQEVNERFLDALSEELRFKEMHETIDLLPKLEDKQQQCVMTLSSECIQPAEDGVAHGSHTGKLPEPGPMPFEDATLDMSPPRNISESFQIQKVDAKESLTEQTDDVNKIIDLPPIINSLQHHPVVTPTPERESMLSIEENLVVHDTEQIRTDGVNKTIDYPAKINSMQHQPVVTPTLEKEYMPPTEEDVVVHDMEQIRADDLNETIDLPTKTKNIQQQPVVMPTPERSSVPPLEEDGVAYESHAEKLPRPFNSPVEDAVALDSQPREVTDQVSLPVGKVDGELLLELIKREDKPETINLPPKMERKQQQIIIMPAPAGESTSQPKENEGSHTVKQPLPRNPLVEDVSVLDKSKLKKVTERIIPEVPKLDERDSFLEQIRTKSFNLKRATPSIRHSIPSQRPTANLKVAAIVEKAIAIRQAMAGSDDEDDNDSWSDS